MPMMMTMRRAIALIGACGLAGCAGSALSEKPPTPVLALGATGKVTFVVKTPRRTTGRLHRQAISFDTESIAIALVSVNGTPSNAAATIVDVTASSGNCSPLGTCSVTATEPVGSDEFAVTAYDEPGGVGTALAAGNTMATVSAAAPTSLTLTLDGIIASVVLAVDLPVLPAGEKAAASLFVNAFDADGASIVGTDPYQSPVTISLDDPQHVATLSTVTVGAPSITPTIALDAVGVLAGSVTFNASVPGVAASAITPATISIANPRGWTNGATFHYTGTTTTTISGPQNTPSMTTVPTVSDETIATVFATPAPGSSATPLPWTIERTVSTTTGTGSSAVPSSATYYYALFGTFATTNLDLLQSDSIDGIGETDAIYENDQIVDEFPATAGVSFSPADAFGETFTPSAGSPYPAGVYNDVIGDGEYTYAESFSNGDVADTTATLANSTYDYTTASGTQINYTFGAPTGAGIAIGQTVVPTGSTSAPAPAATIAPDWYPSGLGTAAFRTDTVTEVGVQTIPAACNVNPSYGASADHLAETYQVLDPVEGYTIAESTDTWEISGTGVVCTQDTTTQNIYYYIGGASNTSLPLSEIFPGTLLSSTTTTIVLGLQSTGTATDVRFQPPNRAALVARLRRLPERPQNGSVRAPLIPPLARLRL